MVQSYWYRLIVKKDKILYILYILDSDLVKEFVLLKRIFNLKYVLMKFVIPIIVWFYILSESYKTRAFKTGFDYKIVGLCKPWNFKINQIFLPDITDFQNLVYYKALWRKSNVIKTFLTIYSTTKTSQM